LIFRISHYATASTSESVFIIGGHTGVAPYYMSKIVEYKEGNWKHSGTLAQARAGHSSITLGSITMIIGGLPRRRSS